MLNIREEIKRLQEIGIRSLHIDIMDGVLVEKIGFSEEVANKIAEDFPDLEIECHLMVCNPLNTVKNLALDKIRRVIVHNNLHMQEVGLFLSQRSVSFGVAVSPHDRPEEIAFPKNTEKILVMGVLPGKGGQAMLPDTPRRLRHVKEMLPHKVYGIDGGVNKHTIGTVSDADEFVLGSCLFSKDPGKALREVEDALANAE